MTSLPLGVRVLLLSLCTAGMSLAAQVYKCTQNGEILLTDKPCHSTAPPSTAAPESSAAMASSSAAIVYWSGQVQYHGSENGQTMPAAQSVVQVALKLTKDGKITGASPDNGCRFLAPGRSNPVNFALFTSISR